VTDWAVGEFLLFTLVFVRMSGLVLFVPFFDDTSHPVQFKAGFAGLLALLVTGLAAKTAGAVEPLQWSLGAYLWAAARELGAGAVIGLAANMVLQGVQLAGQIMGRNIGLAYANVIDPARDIQVSLISQYKMLLVTAVFVGLDGHHVFLLAMIRSYEAVPVAGLTITWPLVDRLAAGVSYLLVVGMGVAAPAIAAGLIANLILGFLGRTVPQMNILIIGFPVRIMLGLSVLLLMSSLMLGITGVLVARGRTEMRAVLQLMRAPG